MKKVLIALDYDPSAQKVAESGFSLAKAMNAEIILLHVLAEPVYYSSMEYSPVMGFTGMPPSDMVPMAGYEEIKEAAQLFLEKAKEHLEDENIKTLITEGEFADEIIKVAKAENVEVIVLGSHGRSGLEKLLVGSVTGQVLKTSTIPLFIIPTKKSRHT